MDPNYYYLEFGISGVLGLLFGHKIENIIAVIILAVIVVAGIVIVNQVESNPTAIASNSTGLVNYVTLSGDLIISLALGSIGTAIGIKVGRFLKGD